MPQVQKPLRPRRSLIEHLWLTNATYNTSVKDCQLRQHGIEQTKCQLPAVWAVKHSICCISRCGILMPVSQSVSHPVNIPRAGNAYISSAPLARTVATGTRWPSWGPSAGFSRPPPSVCLHSIHGIYSLYTGLHRLTKTIGTITDFWHYIR